MRLLLLATVFSAGAVALGFGYYKGHQAAAEAESLRLLEPIVGERLDAAPVASAEALAASTASLEGGNTAPDGSLIGIDDEPTYGAVSGAIGGLGYGGGHGRVETLAGDLPEGVEWIDFPRLALPDYAGEPTFDDEPRPTKEEIFPPEILALDGQKIALDGFMMPIDWVAGSREVSAFILSPYPPGCHFGNIPRQDEYIESTVIDEAGVPWLAYRAIRVIGTLHVGEQIDEYGYVVNIYRIDVESVESLW